MISICADFSLFLNNHVWCCNLRLQWQGMKYTTGTRHQTPSWQSFRTTCPPQHDLKRPHFLLQCLVYPPHFECDLLRNEVTHFHASLYFPWLCNCVDFSHGKLKVKQATRKLVSNRVDGPFTTSLKFLPLTPFSCASVTAVLCNSDLACFKLVIHRISASFISTQLSLVA